MTVHDLKNDQEVSLSTDVANENELLGSLEKLAGDMREKLAADSGDSEGAAGAFAARHHQVDSGPEGL